MGTTGVGAVSAKTAILGCVFLLWAHCALKSISVWEVTKVNYTQCSTTQTLQYISSVEIYCTYLHNVITKFVYKDLCVVLYDI